MCFKCCFVVSAFSQFRFALSEWLHLGVLDRDIQSSPRRKLGRLPAYYLVCERNSIGRIRTQVGMNFPVIEHLCQLGGPWKESSENLLGYPFEGGLETLSIERVD